ncbi:shufflon system plasmid conjugative transfer pilus tip adhesin PilV [Candidatus Regiella endosymbiont of Tuberolachnus salignus]|uniref:shufflon system plasmid conjugative transfer pilus tip adhesin PilV n=1 Tax=Candidatus Regiella endosymbiont of Tuberolachnus salignus TaxID=3077956 RepID=UPI0030D52CFB
MMKKQTVSPVHRGIVVIELLIGLVIIMLAGLYAYPRYTQYLEELEWGVAANHLSTVSRAAKSYIRDKRDTLVKRVKVGRSITVSAAELQQAGYLPAGFSLKNTAAQTYQVGIARDPRFHEQWVAFVLTSGGKAISYAGLRTIAQKVEGAGGYIWPDNVAVGAFAGWEMNLQRYGLRATQGRLAVWLSSEVLGTDRQESDRLYRYKVDNRPDLNRMHTDIDMGKNNLNAVNTVNAGSVKANSGTFTGDINAREGTFDGDIRSEKGWLITGSGKGWKDASHQGGFYMSDNEWIRTLNNKNITTGGQIKAGTMKSDGAIELNTHLQLHQSAREGDSCPEGGIARDSAGQVLSCQSGYWKGTTSSINNAGCQWYSAPNAWWSIKGDKVAQCPKGSVVTGVNWVQWPVKVDDEHVDVLCCPFK